MIFRYWTKQRVQNGLKRFARDYFAGNEKNLPQANHGYRDVVPVEKRREVAQLRLYPPDFRVLQYYKSFYEAWTDLGFKWEYRPQKRWTKPGPQPVSMLTSILNRGRELEDWYILETVGLIPRTEVARDLKRTEAAIKRRLYDLGRINSYNRWGITLSAAAEQLGLPREAVNKYLDFGHIPFLRGNKVFYIDPVDLLKIREIDWSAAVITPALENLIKKSLARRVCRMLLYRESWREKEIYKFNKKKDFSAGRIHKPRESSFAEELPEAPNSLKVGDKVVTTQRLRHIAGKRSGIIRKIYYSPAKTPRAVSRSVCPWVAHVEFSKMKRFTDGDGNLVRYHIPLDRLELEGKSQEVK